VGGGLKRVVIHDGAFNLIISEENLFAAWEEFRQGKRSKPDVQVFELNLEDNIFTLAQNLKTGSLPRISYQQFRITDPKPRLISKAKVSNRLLFHAVYRILYPTFDRTFIFDSYSCREEKGTHRAFQRLVQLTRKISGNFTKPCWSLKCDIKKFFDNIDHEILIDILQRRIKDKKLMGLLRHIIKSFHCQPGKGMPLGNITSQLFANLYLDVLDKFVKHKLKVRYYLRYTDDFILLGRDPRLLISYLAEIEKFLGRRLKLKIHPQKTYLRKLYWGIDFVGYINSSGFNLPRKRTTERILRNMKRMLKRKPEKSYESLQSYLGYFRHVNAYNLSDRLQNS